MNSSGVELFRAGKWVKSVLEGTYGFSSTLISVNNKDGEDSIDLTTKFPEHPEEISLSFLFSEVKDKKKEIVSQKVKNIFDFLGLDFPE